MLLKLTGSIAALGLTVLIGAAGPAPQTTATSRLAVVGQMSISGDMSGVDGAFGRPARPRLVGAPRLDSLPNGTAWGTGAGLRPESRTSLSQLLIGRWWSSAEIRNQAGRALLWSSQAHEG